MESPVRICLSAVFVVHLLLLSSTIETSHGMPHESNATTVGEDKPRTTRHNSTWLIRKPKTPDVALNELHPKDSVSEEHTDKNAKYKDRGRVRFHSQIKASTQSTLRRRSTSTQAPSSTQPVTLIIVTPTPEIKKPAQIIDSMRTYKKTKMPIVVSSSTPLPSSVKTESKSEEHQEYEDGEEEEEADNYEKYTSGKFSDNFFSIPSYNDDTNHDSEGAYNRLKAEFNKPYSSFSTYFPEASYGPNNDDEPYKSESFYNFDSELTTPKHDFFDKKYEEISKSIMKNLETAKAKQPKVNNTNVFKIVKENTGLEKLNNGTPSNKSTVIIKNTKEVRLLDNEKAGTANKELSDVHGTSIYYEMSVLSTETYNINLNDEDCDNDTLPDPTPSTSSEEELASLKATQPTLLPASTQAGLKPEAISTLSSNYIPVSSVEPTYFSSTGALPYSVDPFTSTERTTRIFTSNFSRNRSYSKRLNLAGVKDSPNSVTSRTDIPISNQNIRGPTRKFHYTTPKIKPVWMAPRRNITRTSYPRTTTPATIYSEHFSIKNRTTVQPKTPSRTTLTTVSSEIDPVLQGDVSGVKKIVHSQSILDNSIPTLWKRGSTRYSTSTATTSTEVGSGVSDLEIPPTLTAWALASLRSPPSLGPINTTATTKSVDENELQKVGDLAVKRETTTTSTTVKTTSSSINNDIIPNKINDIEQNKLPWRPLLVPTSSSETHTEIVSIKPESQSTDTNISVQNSDKVTSTTEKLKPEENNSEISKESSEENSQWIPVTAEVDETTTTITETETIPPVDATKSTGFESITKLPSELTTPHDDSASSEQKTKIVTEESVPPTTDYEITTIRFSYKPTEVATETESETETETSTNSWHAVYPTRTKTTTIKDEPITTYRPQYTTTDTVEELTTIIPETTVAELAEELTEVTTQAAESTETTVTAQSIEQTTATTEKPTPEPTSTTITVVTESTSEPEDTTTMIVEVVTEINTERQRPSSTEATSYEVPSTEMTETPPNEMRDNDSSSEENSGSNEVITQETTRPHPTTTQSTTKHSITTDLTTEELLSTTHLNAKLSEPTVRSTTIKEDVETTRVGEDVTQDGDTTTEASSIVLNEEAGSGAAIAIAVSTIGVTALILLVGLLLVVRRRGRRGVYAQRCTPVSLDAYSLDSVSVGHRKGRLRVSKRSYGNPAYDDEVTSHPMQYAALANFALDVESISAEFAEIPSVTVRPDEVPPGCEDKNRYSNVLPLPETRVQLKRIGNDPTSEYINANYITGPGNIRNYYIACQAPLPNTVVDFWRMIWEQNSRVVVMLTEYMENGVEKCYEYLPPSEISDNKRTFGDFQIILMKREQRDKYAVSSVQLINLATRTWREITHLWYFWPAKGVPEDYDSVIDFLSEMRSYMKVSQAAKEYDEEGVEVIYGDQSRSSFHNLSKFRSDDPGSGNGVNVYSPARAEEQMRREGRNGTLGRGKADEGGIRPCTVVCASGAGRSAALIAADVCARALAAAAVDVPRVVRELRAQRPHSLSNRHHYIFLYKLLSEYGNKLMGGGVDTI